MQLYAAGFYHHGWFPFPAAIYNVLFLDLLAAKQTGCPTSRASREVGSRSADTGGWFFSSPRDSLAFIDLPFYAT
jgi:hypothetical protein